MAETFGAVLRSLCVAHGWSMRAFARTVGLSPGHVCRIMQGHERPPLDALPAWADLLQLNDEQRVAFLREGRLTHTPAEIAAEYRALLAAKITKGRGAHGRTLSPRRAAD